MAVAGYQHLSSTGVNLNIKEKNVSAGLGWNGTHNDTSASNNTSAQTSSRNISIGVDPIVDNLNANSWRVATYTNPLPIYYELEPIYDLFYYEDMCTYEFPNKNCTTLRSNLMYAASQYCYWIQNNTDNQVAYCGTPTADPTYGAGQLTTNEDVNPWSEWMYPFKATESTWYVAYQNKKEGMVAMCVQDKAGGQNCATDKAEGETLQEVQVPGPMVCIRANWRPHGSNNKNSSI